MFCEACRGGMFFSGSRGGMFTTYGKVGYPRKFFSQDPRKHSQNASQDEIFLGVVSDENFC